jgi:hypothetical protein
MEYARDGEKSWTGEVKWLTNEVQCMTSDVQDPPDARELLTDALAMLE